jgi:anti-sigma factor RsiW
MLMHCTMAELLALRDGEGSTTTRSHIAACAECSAELERLYQRTAALKALSAFSPPRDRWPPVRDALEAEQRQAQRSRLRWVGLAAAAAIVGVIGFQAIPTAAPAQDLATREVEALVEESQELEQLLASFQRPGRVVNGMTAAAVADLEDRIAAVDFGITRAQEVAVSTDAMADLWRERVVLMDRLVSTHVQQVTYVGQ